MNTAITGDAKKCLRGPKDRSEGPLHFSSFSDATNDFERYTSIIGSSYPWSIMAITGIATQIDSICTETLSTRPKSMKEQTFMQNSSSTQDAPLDKLAFQSLYLENLSTIYRYVYSKVGNREVAEDLTSQVFIKAVRSLNYEYDPQRKRNWLFQVARTTIADYWRDFYRSGTSSLDVLLENGWGEPEVNANEDRLFDHIHAAVRVQHILKALPERDREVLTCRFLLGLSVRETAERMGLTEVNVKVMQYRALKRAAGLESATPSSSQF